MTCQHTPAIGVAAERLVESGVLRTFDAVYHWTCLKCGQPRRTTRLADTIYSLRHAYGWEISTQHDSGNLAIYTLVKAGDMPGDPKGGPHPRRLVGSTPLADQRPNPYGYIDTRKWECLSCHARTDDLVAPEGLLWGWRGWCQNEKATTLWRKLD